MTEPTPAPQEILDRLAKLEAQVAWLVQRAQGASSPEPAGPVPVPRPPLPRPVVPPRMPVPPVAVPKPPNPIVWIAGAGAALFLVGAAFFLHWSIQRGWLGPELRFLMGLAGGGALTALAARLMLRDSRNLGVALLLAGLGTLTFAFRWGAFTAHFFPPLLGFVATFACVLLAGGLGARARCGGALTVAVATGLAAPLVFSQGGDHQVALAVYLLVLLGAATVVPYAARLGARWHGARWVAVAGTWALLASACFTVTTGDAGILLGLLVLHLLAAGIWIWLPGQGEAAPSAPTTLWFGACMAFTGLAAYLWRSELHWMPEAYALPVLGLAALNLALVKPLRVRMGSRQADLGLLALAAGHLALAVPIALGGLYLLVGSSWQHLGTDYRWGLVYGLLTALCYSGFLLILRKLQQEAPSFSFFFNLMLVSGASALFLGLWLVGRSTSFVIPDSTNWLALLSLGLFSQTIGWAMIAGGMPRLRASLTGLVLLVQPLLSFVWDVSLFDRPTTLVNWVGVTGTLLALYLGMLGKAERPHNHEAGVQGERI